MEILPNLIGGLGSLIGNVQMLRGANIPGDSLMSGRSRGFAVGAGVAVASVADLPGKSRRRSRAGRARRATGAAAALQAICRTRASSFASRSINGATSRSGRLCRQPSATRLARSISECSSLGETTAPIISS